MSDRTIRAAVRDGAATVEAVAERTGAAQCCGGCEPMLADILEEELAARASGSSPHVTPRAPASSPHVTTLRPLRLIKDPRAA